MNKKIIFVLAFILLTSLTRSLEISARDFPYADSTTFVGLEKKAKTTKKTVFAVQTEGNINNTDKSDDWTSLGSGFFIKGQNNDLLGITCYHIVKRFIKSNKLLYIGIDTNKGYRRFKCYIVYRDSNNDIAILQPFQEDKENIEVQNLLVETDMLGKDTELVEGRGIIIPGYPLSLGIEDNANYPVVRIGVIAQFSGKDTFLIDGIASHGNSGSPVYSLKYKKLKVLGMITSHVSDNIILYNENGKKAALLPYNSGLVKAAKSSLIEKAIANFYKEKIKDKDKQLPTSQSTEPDSTPNGAPSDR